MCRNIKTLFNFAPPATDEEVRAAALQFVRKLSGSTKPAVVNQPAFDRAVDEVAAAAHRLLDGMTPFGHAKDRAVEAQKAKLRSQLRFQKAKP